MLSTMGYRIIDSHAHIGPYFNFFIPFNNAKDMLKTMDLSGIEATVISSNAAISSDVIMGNKYTLETVKTYPGRFLGHFMFNPNYAEEMKRYVPEYFKNDGIIGFKIHPELSGDYPMPGKGYRYMWEYSNKHRIQVLFHTYFGGDRLEVIEAVAKDYPDSPMLIGHGGSDLGIEKTVDLVNKYPNLYYDMCSPCNKKYGAIKLVAKECNPDKVLFGTDTPWNDPDLSVGAILLSEVEDSIKRKWFSENFFRLYKRASKMLVP